MKKPVVGTLLCLAVLTATFALPAAAAGHPSRLVHTKKGPVTRFVQPEALYKIYNNLTNDPTNLYNCCSGYIISGVDSVFGYSYAEAQAFTPKHNAKITEVETGMSYYGYGANQVDISVYSDNAGTPGTLLATGTATNLQTFGSCCALATVTVSPALLVMKGTQYWIVGDTPTSGTGSDSIDVWNAALGGPTVGYDYDNTGWYSYAWGNGYAMAVLGHKHK
jgi:hypothetical protein